MQLPLLHLVRGRGVNSLDWNTRKSQSAVPFKLEYYISN